MLVNPPQRRPELVALTGLRFAAALGVVAFHLRGHLSALFPGLSGLDLALSAGSLGVELFFVLSGFILGYHYLDQLARPGQGTYRHFLRKRFARIYPMHLASLLLLGLFVTVMARIGRPVSNPEAYTAQTFWANLALVQCWTLDDCGLSWNGPAWSLSAEWLAYLAFPLAAWTARFARRGAVLWSIIALVVVGQLWTTEGSGLHGGIPRVATTFLLGVLLARVHLDGLPRLRWDAIAAWSVAVSIGVSVALAQAGRSFTVVIPLFGVVVLALANAEGRGLAGGLTRALSGARMRFWGDASYALYMTHALVLAAGAEFVRLDIAAQGSLASRLGVIAGYLLAILLVAAVAYQEVERRSRRWLRSSGPGGTPGRERDQQIAQSTPT